MAAATAIDRPSTSLLNFLHKHYGLVEPIWQQTNYVVYEPFFVILGEQLSSPSPMNHSLSFSVAEHPERAAQIDSALTNAPYTTSVQPQEAHAVHAVTVVPLVSAVAQQQLTASPVQTDADSLSAGSSSHARRSSNGADSITGQRASSIAPPVNAAVSTSANAGARARLVSSLGHQQIFG